MSAPNITLLGATYSDVAGVTLPKSGGGTATFPWVEGSETKTQNGTYDVTNLAQLIVNVSGGGGSGKTFETGTYTPTSNTARPSISFANTHTVPPAFIHLADASAASGITSNSTTSFTYVDTYRLFGGSYPYSTSEVRYGLAYWTYRSSSSSSSGNVQFQYNSDDTGSSGTSYARYWATPTEFHPYSNSNSRYFRSGRTYKWIAVWM